MGYCGLDLKKALSHTNLVVKLILFCTSYVDKSSLSGSGKFNRAMLLNVGALEALKQYQYDCFIFHDVDLLPEDDRNLYTCPEQPRHMSIAIDSMSYRYVILQRGL